MSPRYHHLRDDRQEQASQCWLKRVNDYLNVLERRNESTIVYPRVSETSQARRDASLTEPSITTSDINAAGKKGKTVLYLAYGSNLCNEIFRGKRGIKPLSQINVVVPSLRLTFDLPGVPYLEPCFGNTAMRDPVEDADYHKDRWKKGLVGCVYEVTPSDYAHIIATEGGGAGYQDIPVDCYPLPDGDTVPEKPTTQRFVARTLFAPAAEAHARPDPSYAQPSARYLNLITTGAAELSLPREYQKYLNDIRTYTITTKRQQIGKTAFAAIWWPLLQMLFTLNAQFQDDRGRSPPWLAQLAKLLFVGMWGSYDAAFKQAFGDGERTEGSETSDRIPESMDKREWRRIGRLKGWLQNREDAGDTV
ncbi:hypothetical protein BU23DRAFT_555920 [Bimuria novae-zelandiae CBS 107.79]|uniref:gamma-glutamylcyclotransferase n=1 Tax=Bimuria novae-zelandiae CBS 107.79 TaxID=1447943 RepID=A0A6A5VDT3_9PLEO|nr:hypothetical protein BU23DRAFT_555920 [Bimuria novae-zelandiae CBS 107.79]